MDDQAMTQTEFARHNRWRPSYVTQLKREGRLVLNGRRVLLKASLARIAETADPSKAGVVDRHEAKRTALVSASAQTVEAESGEAANDPVSSSGVRYSDARAQKEHYLALAAKRDYEERLGQLLRADDVLAAVRNAATILRGGMESLADTLAPQLAVVSDEARVRAILAENIEQLLESTSHRFHGVAVAAQEQAA